MMKLMTTLHNVDVQKKLQTELLDTIRDYTVKAYGNAVETALVNGRSANKQASGILIRNCHPSTTPTVT